MRVHFKVVKKIGLRGRAFLLAMLIATTSLLNIPISKPAHAAIGSVTDYAVPASVWSLDSIGMGPDGNIWYTATGNLNSGYTSKVGKLTPTGVLTDYGNRTGGGKNSWDITKGADGNLWFPYDITTSYPGYSITDYRIVNMTPSGTVLGTYTTSNYVTKMTLGPDGDVWFLGGNGIGKITPSGTVTNFGLPSSYGCGQTAPVVNGITGGPDGNVWFTIYCTGSYKNAVGKITSSGVFTVYPIPAALNIRPGQIITGSDGNLWFTEPGVNKIGTITPSGTITQYSLPAANLNPSSITAGSDGALWFTQSNGKIGRMTTSGVATEYSVPGSAPGRLITGPDGAVWFIHGDKIGRMATELTSQTISFTSAAPTSATIDSPAYTPTATATSGLPVAITVDPSSSSVCSITSGVVSYQSAGTCTLNANQGGDADYKPAPQVQQSFTVAPVDAESSVALNCLSTASVGDTVTCTITVSNNGPAASESASLTALFPSSLTNASLSGGGTLSGQTITWSLPSLASGASTTLTFSATASAWGKAKLSAALLQTSPDPDNSNNLATSTIVVH